MKSWVAPTSLPVKHVLGALGVVDPARMLSPGLEGDVGLIAFQVQDTKHTSAEIHDWLVTVLVKQMNPYPLPRSLLVLDNSSLHRTYQQEIEEAVNKVGALVLWNPPQSPDFNAIEKYWDVCLAHTNRLALELAAGLHGASRAFNEADLINVLIDARVTQNVLYFKHRSHQ